MQSYNNLRNTEPLTTFTATILSRNMLNITSDTNKVLSLLEKLIATESISRNENVAADIVYNWFSEEGYTPERINNNIICRSHHWDDNKQTILLNSHIDTVKPASAWTKNPYKPEFVDGRLYGLGSNDAGASLTSLMLTFCKLDQTEQSYNILFAATAEEEVSGANGMKSIAPLFGNSLPEINLAIVGEPTDLQPAFAEKGLMVVDATVKGESGHAAREEGINALYRALDIIQSIRQIPSELQVSSLLGAVKMTVTMINSGTQHNVIPDICTFTIDIRSNELYSNQELFNLLQNKVPEWCTLTARSFVLNSSSFLNSNGNNSAIVNKIMNQVEKMELKPFGSPTLSDQAILSCPSFKIGPGCSARSHTADEYILTDEISNALSTYYNLLNGI